MKKLLVCLGLGCAVVLSAGSLSDEKVGFRKNLSNDLDVKLPEFKWSEDAPGTSKRIERSFENAPPMIPHSLEGLVPITKDNNMCVTCHMPEVAADMGATPIPKSHTFDMRTEKDLNGTLAEQRFNCTQCHAPQADAKPLVKNKFKADFRYKDSNSSSNLLDILNQGAE